MKFLYLVFAFATLALSQTLYSQPYSGPDGLGDATGEPLLAYSVEGKWHILDHTGKEMIEPLPLVRLFGYSEGLFAARAINPETKKPISIFFDKNAQVQIVSDAEIIDPFKNGMAITANLTGIEEIPFRAGFINKNGEQVVPMDYVDFSNFDSGLAYVMDTLAKNGWRGYIDTSGKRIIELPRNVAGFKFNQGIAAVADSFPNVGYINTKGEYVLPPIYDSPGVHSEGMIATANDGFLGYISTETKEFEIAPEFDVANPFNQGRAWVGKMAENGKLKYALVDKEGGMIRNFMFDYVTDFSEDMATVYVAGKFTYIDRAGEFPLGQTFTYCAPFKNGLAWAADMTKGTAGFINKKGEIVVKAPPADKYLDLRTNKELGLTVEMDSTEMESETE